MSYAIPARKFSKEGPESRREGGFENLCLKDRIRRQEGLVGE
jgi:hypothetical protein